MRSHRLPSLSSLTTSGPALPAPLRPDWSKELPRRGVDAVRQKRDLRRRLPAGPPSEEVPAQAQAADEVPLPHPRRPPAGTRRYLLPETLILILSAGLSGLQNHFTTSSISMGSPVVQVREQRGDPRVVLIGVHRDPRIGHMEPGGAAGSKRGNFSRCRYRYVVTCSGSTGFFASRSATKNAL